MFENIILEAKSFPNKLSESGISLFGYRERIQIERLIFLCIKLSLIRYGYDLHGLSNEHFNNLKTTAIQNKWPRDLVNIINEAFELKIYLKHISSSNAYVRNDALLRLSHDLTRIIPIISNKFIKLISKIDKFNYSIGLDLI